MRPATLAITLLSLLSLVLFARLVQVSKDMGLCVYKHGDMLSFVNRSDSPVDVEYVSHKGIDLVHLGANGKFFGVECPESMVIRWGECTATKKNAAERQESARQGTPVEIR